MLNIRINLAIDLRKVGVVILSSMLAFSPVISAPAAHAVTVIAPSEMSVTVNLTYLSVTTTPTEAKKSLASSDVKYFDVEALAFLTTYSKGWNMKEWKCLRNVWQHESHFNPKAKNMGSGAYGIAQFMPDTWGNYKVAKTSEAKLQIKYGLRYIQVRYGSKNDPTGACGAWRFWQRNNWY